jgi:hypothetical protein
MNIEELLEFGVNKYDHFLVAHAGKTSIIVVSVPLTAIKMIKFGTKLPMLEDRE